MTVIDVHTHFIPRSLLDSGTALRGSSGVEPVDGGLAHAEGLRYPVQPEFYDVAAKLHSMDAMGIDVAVLSLAPTLFFYEAEVEDAVGFARWCNDALAELVDGQERLLAFAHLPLQAPDEAAAELERCITELGFHGAQIGTSAPGRPLDAREFEPLLAVADRHRLPIMLHPTYVGPKPGLEEYYLTNSLGNPIDTTIAGARLIYGGALERFPELRVVLVHAGGFLPYQLGRLDHAYEVRREPREHVGRLPSAYFDRLFMDTITHGDAQLEFLASFVGTDRLVLGTDLPFDMGDPRPLERLGRAGVDEHALGETAARLLRLRATTTIGEPQ